MSINDLIDMPVSGGRVCSTFFQRDWMMEEMP